MTSNAIATIYKDMSVMQPLIFGLSDVIRERVEDTNLAGGAVFKDFSTVPAGYVYVITALAVRYIGTIPQLMYFAIYDGVNTDILWGVLNGVNNAVNFHNPTWILKPGENIRLGLGNATATNDVFAYINGYKMRTDQA